MIETLLPFANDAVLARYMKAFGDDLRPICSDRFATHVLEALVIQSTTRSLLPDKPEDVRESYKSFALKISKFLLNNLEDFVWDTYGNHVIRTCLLSLAKIPKEDPKGQIDVNQNEDTDIPEYYAEIVNDYGERLIVWPQFKELCNNELTSGFLQVLMKALKKTNKKLLNKYMKKLLEEIFAPDEPDNNPNTFPPVFLSKSTMMLLETALQVAKSKMYTQIYLKCFQRKLLKLAVTRMTNFSVQKLLANCEEKTEVSSLLKFFL